MQEDSVRLFDDLGFTEGPVDMGGGGLAFTVMSKGAVFIARNGALTSNIYVGGGPTGMARTRDGELFVVRNSGLWGAPADAPPGVVRISTSGEVADVFTDGLQAPNDVCFGPDRALYFTDPVSDRGLSEAVEGFVYRLDLESGACTRVLSGLLFPNGLAFSADATLLYVAESFASRIVACPVDSGIIGAPEVFYDVGDGQPDGFCLDIDGRLFVCVPDRDEIHIVAPDGLRRAVIGLGAGAFPTNCCFYGEDRTRLAVTVSAYGGVASLDPRCRGLALLD